MKDQSLAHRHHKHPGLGHLTRSVSRVTAALSIVSSVSQLFSFLVSCKGMISRGFGFVAFFVCVRASSFCIHLSCLICSLSVVQSLTLQYKSLFHLLSQQRSKSCSVSTGNRLQNWRPENRGWIPVSGRYIFLHNIQNYTRAYPVSSVKAAQLYLFPTLRMRGVLHPLPHTSSQQLV